MSDTHGRGPTPRDAISCATGILMERYGWDADRAGARLIRWSVESEVDIPVVAAWLIDQVGGPAGSAAPAGPDR